MKLKPCPFCGSKQLDVLETQSGIMGLSGEYFIWCQGCYSQSGNFNTKRDATVAWNRRFETAKGKA